MVNIQLRYLLHASLLYAFYNPPTFPFLENVSYCRHWMCPANSHILRKYLQREREKKKLKATTTRLRIMFEFRITLESNETCRYANSVTMKSAQHNERFITILYEKTNLLTRAMMAI